MQRSSKTWGRALALATLAVSPLVAHAGWTQIPVPAGLQAYIASARVCKTAINSIYGTLWRANFQVFRSDARASRITIWTTRGGTETINRQFQDQWLYGVVAGTGNLAYASPFHEDTWNFQVNFSQPVWDRHHLMSIVGATFDLRPRVATVAYC